MDAFIEKEPPFLLSSSFPFVSLDNGFLYLLPRPITETFLPMPTSQKEYDRQKDFQKIRYLSASLFQDLVNGIVDNRELYNRIDDNLRFYNGALVEKEILPGHFNIFI